jgi:hypothetical protein
MPIDIVKPFLDLMEKANKPRGVNGDARLHEPVMVVPPAS